MGLGAKVSVGPDWFVVQTSEGASSGTELDHSSCNDPFVLIEDLSALHAGVKATQGHFLCPLTVGWSKVESAFPSKPPPLPETSAAC